MGMRFINWLRGSFQTIRLKILNFWYAKPALPATSLPYNVALKRQQERWLITFILLIALTGYYAYVYLEKQRVNNELVTVLVATQNLARPLVLQPEHLSTETFAQSKLPNEAYLEADKKQLLGKTLVRDVVANEILLPHHVQSKLNPDSVSAQFENAFAFTMDENWLQAKLPNLKAGDVIDVLVSNPDAELEATISVAEGLEVITVQKLNQKKTLIVKVTDAQAKQILFARGLRLPMQILLHSALKNPSNSSAS